MDILLDKLVLENFKGVSGFILEPQGRDVEIRGDNGTGKTTVADAFRWLLFGKDMAGRSDFAIKTLDKNGEEIHNLEHSVEAELNVSDHGLTLKKTLKEKWTKKRGSSKKEFTGHTTDHFVDGVPIQKKEWDSRIADLIDEETFKLLTSPTYFNDLHWQKRREALLDVCGDVADEEVIASDAKLKDLPKILGDRNLEDQRKVIAGRRREINKRLEEIPARIDELTKSLKDVPKNPEAVEANIKYIQDQIQTARDDSTVADLRKQKAEAEAELAEAKALQDKERRVITVELAKMLEAAEKEHREATRQIADAKSTADIADAENISLEAQMAALRDEYREIASRGPEIEGKCPTCGQDLPEDQIEAAKAKHNERQAKELAEINAHGKKLKAKKEKAQRDKAEAEKTIAEIKPKLEPLNEKIAGLQSDIEKAGNVETKHDKSVESLQYEIASLETRIAKSPQQADTSELERDLAEAQNRLAEYRAAGKSKERIKELEGEEKQLSAEFEELEYHSWLMDRFVVQKVGMLESKINSRFELARFKLFETQINEGIRETCVTTVGGVPYGSGLNTGAEINAGLDIIRTLSEHYGVQAPVFIDHAESVTEILDPGSQTIKLIVDEKHKKMEVSYYGTDTGAKAAGEQRKQVAHG